MLYLQIRCLDSDSKLRKSFINYYCVASVGEIRLLIKSITNSFQEKMLCSQLIKIKFQINVLLNIVILNSYYTKARVILEISFALLIYDCELIKFHTINCNYERPLLSCYPKFYFSSFCYRSKILFSFSSTLAHDVHLYF